MYTADSSTERMSADYCLKKSLGSYMKQTLNIVQCCKASIAIPNVVMVKTQVLLCSSGLTIPTWTYKTQLSSMRSISCNIQHLTNQQRKHNIQWSKLRKSTFDLYWQANTANLQSAPHDNVIIWMKAGAAWQQKGSGPMEHCTACDVKRSLRRRNNEKHTC